MSVREYVVYIHGVQPDVQGGSHKSDYDALHDAIIRRPGLSFYDRIDIEWGWEAPGVQEANRLLTKAQENLGNGVFGSISRSSWDWTVNPARIAFSKLRDLVFYGFGDMFYYVSEDGKKSVRQTIASKICSKIFDSQMSISPEPSISLTIVGHSAGAVAAFDFLYFLFSEHSSTATQSEEERAKTWTGSDLPDLIKLRRWAKAGNLRIRKFYSLGSPISLVAFRKNEVLELLANNQKLNPGDYGFESDFNSFMDQLSGEKPRWVNIWDKDDPISWPVEPLMNNGKRLVQDLQPDVGDGFMTHTAYWRSKEVHRIIADNW